MQINKITSKDIKRYRNEVLKSSSASTFDRKIFSLKKFFEFAVKEGFIDENPVEDFLKEEEEIIKTSLGKIERKRKLSSPSYDSLQARIIARFAEKPKLQKFFYNLFYTRPQWYQSYHKLPISNYFNYAILIILMSALGFGIYTQFFKTTSPGQAYPTALTRAGRYLSFQGRLTNNLNTPITTATNITFKLYDADSGGSTLWNSGTCSITPDGDGIFSTLLGSSCGTEIDSSVFSENAEVWLGVTVAGDAEATPRIQIATVAYALNSETLQGYPASESATANTIPALNSSGQLVLAESSPKIQSTSGTFAIEGQALTITTPNTSNGSITINPDGTGTLDLTFEGSSPGGGAGGFVNATNANLATGSLYYGEVANGATGYNLLQLASGASPTDKFVVDYAGNVTAAGTINGLTISSGTISSGTWNGTVIGTQYGGTGQNWNSVAQGSIPYFSATGVMNTLSPTTAGYVLSTNGAAADPSWIPMSAAGNWTLGALGVLYPNSSSADVLIGGTATSSAKFAFKNVLTGVPTASISGTTSNVATFVDGNGNISTTNRANLLLGNSSTYNSTGSILMNSNGVGLVGIGTNSPLSTLMVVGTSTNATGKAALIIDQYQSEDILTASASGSTKMTLANDGTLNLYNASSSIANTSGDITVDSVADIILDAEGADIYFKNAGTTFAQFTDSSTDLTLDITGGQLILADTDTINIGGLSGYAYNSLASGTDVKDEAAISADNDLYIGGDLEVDGTTYSDGLSVGTLTGMIKGTSGVLSAVTGTSNYLTYWSDNNTIAAEQYATTAQGGLGANVTAAGAGEILYSTGTSAYDSLTAGTSGMALISGGAGAPSWGTLGTTYGGTGANNSTAAQYSIPYYSTAGVLGGILAPSTDGYVLTTHSTGGAPTWTAASGLVTNYWQLNGNALSPGNSTYALNIGNTASTSAFFHVPGTNNDDAWFNLGTGNVGIGTISPEKTLDVNGDMRIRGDNATLNFYRTTSPSDIASIAYDNAVGSFSINANNKTFNINNGSSFANNFSIT